MPKPDRPPKKPEELKTPGLKWRERVDGWTAYWVARGDIVARGFMPKTQYLWPPTFGVPCEVVTVSEFE